MLDNPYQQLSTIVDHHSPLFAIADYDESATAMEQLMVSPILLIVLSAILLTIINHSSDFTTIIDPMN